MGKKIAIIGGGIAGLMCAWRLAQRGAEVALFERDLCGAGASGAAVGALIPYGWSRTDEIAKLQRASLAKYADLAAEIKKATQQDIGYNVCGRYQLLGSEHQLAQAEVDVMHSNGQAEIVSMADLFTRLPELEPSEYGAYYCKISAQVEPFKFILALKAAAAAAASGVVIEENHNVTDVASLREKFDTILITAGAWSHQLAPDYPVKPVRGQALKIQLPQPVFSSIIRYHEVYLVPQGDAVVVGATTEPDAGYEVVTTDEGIRTLLEKAYSLVPELEQGEVVATWAGLRPKADKILPLIRAGEPNVFVCASHYKLGYCLAPAIGEAAVEKLL